MHQNKVFPIKLTVSIVSRRKYSKILLLAHDIFAFLAAYLGPARATLPTASSGLCSHVTFHCCTWRSTSSAYCSLFLAYSSRCRCSGRPEPDIIYWKFKHMIFLWWLITVLAIWAAEDSLNCTSAWKVPVKVPYSRFTTRDSFKFNLLFFVNVIIRSTLPNRVKIWTINHQ